MSCHINCIVAVVGNSSSNLLSKMSLFQCYGSVTGSLMQDKGLTCLIVISTGSCRREGGSINSDQSDKFSLISSITGVSICLSAIF